MTSYNTSGNNGDVLKTLRFDHKRIGDLFFHFEQSEDPLHKLSFAQTAMNELTIHSQLEERLFYPFLRKHVPDDIIQLLDRLETDHMQIDETMHQLAHLGASDDCIEQFSRLAETVKNHFQKEEKHLFAALMGIDLNAILPEFAAMRRSLVQSEGGSAMAPTANYTPQILLFGLSGENWQQLTT